MTETRRNRANTLRRGTNSGPRSPDPIAAQAASTVQFGILEPRLRKDIRSSIAAGINAGAAFGCAARPLSVFRHAVLDALSVDETRLGFLLRGVEADGSSTELTADRVEQYVAAVRLAVSRVVAALQGVLAELLAVGPCTALLQDLQQKGWVSPSARLYFGDTVLVPRLNGSDAKAADLHILVEDPNTGSMEAVGVGEVKSYPCSRTRLQEQLAKHLARLKQGNLSLAETAARTRRSCPVRTIAEPLRISVLPSSWHLSRHYRIVRGRDRSWILEPSHHPEDSASLVHQDSNEWRIVLGWSHEALAASAFDMLHWYLGCLGSVIYSQPGASPWPDLSPEEAGRHAAVMMLYYALLQALAPRTEAQLIKLYNVLGFGYALGAHFRAADGKLEMLWCADLDEILRGGCTRDGSRIAP